MSTGGTQPTGDQTPSGQPFDYRDAGCGGTDGYSGDRVCGCLAKSLARIAGATETIAVLLARKQEKACDQIDGCMDKIIDKLRQKFERPLKTCDECKQMAANGAGGTFEYALSCAGCIVDDCNNACSMGDKATWGKCCKGCGQEKCICDKGECKPVEEEEKKGKRFVGWCNRATGIWIVTKEGSAGPGAGFERVALESTEQAAAQNAAAQCTGTKPPPTPKPVKRAGFGFGNPSFCNLSDLVEGQVLAQAESAIAAFNRDGGALQFLEQLSQIGFGGITVGTPFEAAVGLARMLTGGPPFLAMEGIRNVANVVGCNYPGFTKSFELMATAQMFGGSAGVDLTEYLLPYKYAMNAACRQKQLTPDMALAAYYGNAISEADLDRYWAIGGFCPQAGNDMSFVGRAKPVPLQLAVMRRRELIDEEGYQSGMRQLGYLEPKVSDDLFKLTEQFPTPTDIIRLMVRDADDENGVVKDFNLDAKFEDKYPVGGKLRKWAEYQGVPVEVAKYLWRAHWSIPSPGQLFNFYHRLRKDPAYPDLLKNVKDALIQQDILPFWHEHFLKTSFLPIGRIDIRRAYNIGSLNDAEVKHAYTQLGYSDDTVDILFKYTQRLRDSAIIGHRAIKLWNGFQIDLATANARLLADGFPQPAIDKALADSETNFSSSALSKAFVRGDIPRLEYVNRLIAHGVSRAGATKLADKLGLSIRKHVAASDYAAGVITRADASAQMLSHGMDFDIVSSSLDQIDRAVVQSLTVNCQKGIKRRYLLGEITKDEARAELVQRGTVIARADMLVDWFDCEKSSIGKAVPAAKLCEWLSRGAITSVDMQNRLERLGYLPEVAAMLIEDCLITISTKRLRQAKKEAKEQASEQRRIQNALNKAQSAQARNAYQLYQASVKAAKTRQNRDRQMLSAAQKITAKSGIDLYDALDFAKGQAKRVERDYGLTIDEGLQTVLKAVEACPGCQFPDLTETVTAMAEAVESADFSRVIPGTTPSTNGNG